MESKQIKQYVLSITRSRKEKTMKGKIADETPKNGKYPPYPQ